MSYIGWRFPPLSGGSRQGYTNNDIETFKGQGLMDNLTREICQNSLDAKDPHADGPVIVKFELRRVSPSNYQQVFKRYEDCIKGCERYWGEDKDDKLTTFLKSAKQTLSMPEIPVLVASDYNTTGLEGCGASNDRGSFSSPWVALTDADGMSVKDTDTSGGSFGIGKNAPFACSSLSMVFYNTHVSDSENAFVGVARLATLLNEREEETQRVGKYQFNDERAEENKDKWRPIYRDDSDTFRDLFRRDCKGTDVIIVGFDGEKDWMDSIAVAVLKNFFVAVCECKLEVKLKEGDEERTIDTESINELMLYYSKNKTTAKEMKYTKQFYSAFKAPDLNPRLTFLEEGDAEMFVKSDDSFNKKIVYFRDNGMLIHIKGQHHFQQYAAVIIIRGNELAKLLRACEPAKHDRWDPDLINGLSEKEERTRARRTINKIYDTVRDRLSEHFQISSAESVDAAGVGKYLPDSDESGGTKETGADILRPKIKIADVKIRGRNYDKKTYQGMKKSGKNVNGDVHNKTKCPIPLGERAAIPHPILEGGAGTSEGVAQGDGTKTVSAPNMETQRAFPISVSEGLYKIVLVPSETYNNLQVSCMAVGENNQSDFLKIENFSYRGRRVRVSNNVAGPLKVEAGEPAEFFVKFAEKEKMVLNLLLTEDTPR